MAEEPPAKKMKEEDLSDEEISATPTQSKPKRVPRKKCILVLSYCGKGYMGMQRNPGVPTIEEELIQALWKADAISENHRDNLGKLNFQRCARTDKGVSAARQIVSLKMVPDPNIISIVNQHLPEQIRVIGLKQVTKGFNSKEACTSRVYEYLIPTFAYAPFKDTNLTYRISTELLSKIQNHLNKYHGTHNFHNFTSGKKHDDPSALRYIMSFSVGHPFVCRNIEFVSLSVEGQSFMLNQIRKMIGLVIGIIRGYCPEDAIEQAYNPPKLDIPRAPALGLYLDEVRYNRYNKKFGNDGLHEKLEWTEYEDLVSSFKEKFILKHIIDTELKEHTMLEWLQTLQLHDFNRTEMSRTKEELNKGCEEEKSEEVKSTDDIVDGMREEETKSNEEKANEIINEVSRTKTD